MGGGAVGGFRRGSVEDMLSRAGDAADDFAQKLGRATLEGVRFATWSRPLTMLTFGLQAYPGATAAAGLAGAGVAGGLGMTAALSGAGGLRALGSQAGRAGAMDMLANPFRRLWGTQGITGGIGPSEAGLIREQNIAYAQQETARFGWAQQQQALSTAVESSRINARLAPLQARFLAGRTGVLPPGDMREQLLSAFDTQMKAYARGRTRLESIGNEYRTSLPPDRPFPKGYDAGGTVGGEADILYGYGGYDPTRASGYSAAQQERQVQRQTAYGAKTRTQLLGTQGDVLGRMQANLGAAEKIGTQYLEQMRSEQSQMQATGERRLRLEERITEESGRRLAEMKGAQVGAAMGALAFQPPEIKQGIRQLEGILAGGKVPRGEQISPALAFLMQNLAPDVTNKFYGQIGRLPDIQAVNKATGWASAVPKAEQDLKEAEARLTQFEAQFNKDMASLREAMHTFLKRLESLFREQAMTEGERAQHAKNVNEANAGSLPTEK